MIKKEVNQKDILEYVKKYISTVEDHYGLSKHHLTTPYVYMNDEKIGELKGEYCYILNEITVYWKNITSLEELIRTIIHEYQHYLQSPSWMTRYYNIGHDYESHPYEIAAFNEEENWKTIWEAAA
jgi:hypothetical protein